ncbi:MAG: hypothetical protein HC892_01670 [Saprospiraceae bacterium]|nr:hypothetical protein [Saprospiraceae bacterium]
MEAKEIKIKGSITVEFELKTDKVSLTKLEYFAKSNAKDLLTHEIQIGKFKPKMDSFKFKQVKK